MGDGVRSGGMGIRTMRKWVRTALEFVRTILGICVHKYGLVWGGFECKQSMAYGFRAWGLWRFEEEEDNGKGERWRRNLDM